MIYLTYDININNDGLGAQYQRIVGIICISHYYNFIYVHTPIEKMEHTNNLNDIENFFQISNNYLNINSINYDEIFEENNPTINLTPYIESVVIITPEIIKKVYPESSSIYKEVMDDYKFVIKWLEDHNIPFTYSDKEVTTSYRR